MRAAARTGVVFPYCSGPHGPDKVGDNYANACGFCGDHEAWAIATPECRPREARLLPCRNLVELPTLGKTAQLDTETGRPPAKLPTPNPHHRPNCASSAHAMKPCSVRRPSCLRTHCCCKVVSATHAANAASRASAAVKNAGRSSSWPGSRSAATACMQHIWTSLSVANCTSDQDPE